MIVTVRKSSDKQDVQRLIQQLTLKGIEVNYSEGNTHIVLGLVGDTTGVDITWIRSFQFVQDVTRVAAPYKKANRQFHPEDTIVDVLAYLRRLHE